MAFEAIKDQSVSKSLSLSLKSSLKGWLGRILIILMSRSSLVACKLKETCANSVIVPLATPTGKQRPATFCGA